MTKEKKRRRYCPGCRDNFYNNHNPLGVAECWHLKRAKVVWRKLVPIHQCPPHPQRNRRFLSCYSRDGYVFA